MSENRANITERDEAYYLKRMLIGAGLLLAFILSNCLVLSGLAAGGYKVLEYWANNKLEPLHNNIQKLKDDIYDLKGDIQKLEPRVEMSRSDIESILRRMGQISKEQEKCSKFLESQ